MILRKVIVNAASSCKYYVFKSYFLVKLTFIIVQNFSLSSHNVMFHAIIIFISERKGINVYNTINLNYFFHKNLILNEIYKSKSNFTPPHT